MNRQQKRALKKQGRISSLAVGHNVSEGVVKIRSPDPEMGGFIVQIFSAEAARKLADWLDDGTPGKLLKINDGKRWISHECPPETCTKLAADLRSNADTIDPATIH